MGFMMYSGSMLVVPARAIVNVQNHAMHVISYNVMNDPSMPSIHAIALLSKHHNTGFALQTYSWFMLHTDYMHVEGRMLFSQWCTYLQMSVVISSPFKPAFSSKIL